jgi:hypothetical protein
MIARRGALSRRTGAEWGTRGVIGIALAVLGYVTIAQTLGYLQRYRDPGHAYALWPHDGRVTALAAQHLATSDASFADRLAADRLARLALRQDPTAVAAASTLGLNAQIGGNIVGARRLFSFSEMLSRRDLQTQLWAIEDAVGRGDVAGALHHYDIALRTARNAPDLLYPVMAGAIADPSVRAAMVGILEARPPWGGFFIDFVSGNGPDAHATASLFLALRRAGVPISDGANATIVNTLATRGSLDDAWKYYAAIRPGSDRRISRDRRFAAMGTASLFDWTPTDEPGMTVTIQRAERGGLLDFSVSSGLGGTLLRQVQLLPPGRYRLSGRGEGIDQPLETLPYWALACRSDGRELGRVVMTASVKNGGQFAGMMDVPTGCPVQTLALVARPSAALAGLAGQIKEVELRPASAGGKR